MNKGKRIIKGIVAIVLPIALMAISGVTEVMVSEMISIPSALVFFTGKGVI